jgi:hypothetical protein
LLGKERLDLNKAELFSPLYQKPFIPNNFTAMPPIQLQNNKNKHMKKQIFLTITFSELITTKIRN